MIFFIFETTNALFHLITPQFSLSLNINKRKLLMFFYWTEFHNFNYNNTTLTCGSRSIRSFRHPYRRTCRHHFGRPYSNPPVVRFFICEDQLIQYSGSQLFNNFNKKRLNRHHQPQKAFSSSWLSEKLMFDLCIK